MRPATMLIAALAAAFLPHPAPAATVCAWIVETSEDGDTHKFALNLGADAPASVAVRFAGANFTSASMGGDMIALEPGAPQEVDAEGFDVSPGDDLRFDVRFYDRPLATLEEMEKPTFKALAAFVFERKVGEGEKAPPASLAVKQCFSPPTGGSTPAGREGGAD